MELVNLESHLRQKHPSLQIINRQDYLHLWLPFSQESLQFLPLFHAIVTLDNEEVKCRLFTYHGKQVQKNEQNLSSLLQGEEKSVLDNVQNLGLCQGISSRNALSSVQELIHEPFADKIVCRSRDCKYAVQLPKAMVGRGIALSCIECSKVTEACSGPKNEAKSQSLQ